MTQSTGRVMVTSGLSTITLTLRHWDLSPQATLHLDEARELVRQMQKALDAPAVAERDFGLQTVGARMVVTRPEVYSRDDFDDGEDLI